MTNGLALLDQLVRRAAQECEAETCARNGHAWEMQGGRRCPRGCRESQPAYQCRRCGEWDYGYRGGPAHADCYAGGVQCCDGSTEDEHELEGAE